jgi:hypothetical protein
MFAESELETSAIKSSMLNKKGSWDAYLSVHSKGNSWLIPWGYTDDRIADYYDLHWKASIGIEAMRLVKGFQNSKSFK